ncbi:hypothetical protein [Pseudoxanthomonas kalamensis]|uniref:hypothetical protein n=1 Tax=Pseudoxanthomonas kalamensis TaxID=289483 RepID=UPI001B8798C1|nr:hypothetical protein [Pseudoxanthomonas kalamensis]
METSNPAMPWWMLPTILFLAPLLVALIHNLFFKHKWGVNANWVLALFVLACWISALVIILRAVN